MPCNKSSLEKQRINWHSTKKSILRKLKHLNGLKRNQSGEIWQMFGFSPVWPSDAQTSRRGTQKSPFDLGTDRAYGATVRILVITVTLRVMTYVNLNREQLFLEYGLRGDVPTKFALLRFRNSTINTVGLMAWNVPIVHNIWTTFCILPLRYLRY